MSALNDEQGILVPSSFDLTWSASLGDYESVERILEDGIDVNDQDYLGRMALHLSCLKGHIDIVRLLLQHQADVNVPDSDGKTPLQHALVGEESRHGNRNVQFEIVKLLVENHANVNAKIQIGQTALHLALGSCWNLDVVTFLLENNANVNIKESGSGQTPLHIACGMFADHFEIIPLLVENYYADISIRDNFGRTAEEEAVRLLKLWELRRDEQGREWFKRIADYLCQQRLLAPVRRRHTMNWLTNGWRLRRTTNKKQ